jgi:TolB protein
VFTATEVKDPDTGEVVNAHMWSIILSAKGDGVVFDLWGGTVDHPSEQWDIWVGNADGTGLAQVTNDSYEDLMPQFSPDGTKVVFNSYRGCDGNCAEQIIIRNVDGSGEQVLPLPVGTENTWAPTFSPDGTKIAVEIWGYNETLGEFDGIFTMNTDGTNQQMITNPWAEADVWDEMPSFTKDGSKIVFNRVDYSSESRVENVFIMNADGSNVTMLTDNKGYNLDPLILGDMILLNSNRDETASGNSGYEIYRMNLDGSNLTRLTSNALFEGFCIDRYVSEGESAAQHLEHHHIKSMHNR